MISNRAPNQGLSVWPRARPVWAHARRLLVLQLVSLIAACAGPAHTLRHEPTTLADSRVIESWQAGAPKGVNVFHDGNGSQASLLIVAGPKPAEVAIQLTYDITKEGWAGVSSELPKVDLSRVQTLSFMSKANQPGMFDVRIVDTNGVRYVANFRIGSTAWSETPVPMSRFFKDPWFQPPEARQDLPKDFAHISRLEFSPRPGSKGEFWIGPVAAQSRLTDTLAVGSTGVVSVVQDYERPTVVAASAHSLAVEARVERAPETNQGSSLVVKYDCPQAAGHCDVWGSLTNPDWRGAKALLFRIWSSREVLLSVSFMDKNGVGYTATAPPVQVARSWQTVIIPIDWFEANRWFQPPGAKTGSTLDLTDVPRFGVAPIGAGAGRYVLDDVAIVR